MSDRRYPHLCFSLLLECSLEQNNGGGSLGWLSRLQRQCRDLGVTVAWSDRVNLFQFLKAEEAILIRNHADRLFAEDVEAAYNSDNCPHYRKLNPNFEIGEQLGFQMPIVKVRCVTQLRMATNISIYLYIGDRGTKLNCMSDCPICNMHEKEDVEHFLIRCPMYNSIRPGFLGEITRNVVSDADKIMVLLSNLSEGKINRLFLYVSKAIEIRSLICSVDT